MNYKGTAAYIHSIINEVILYQSTGVLPYTFLIYEKEQFANVQSVFPNYRHIVAVFVWSDFSADDVLDYLENSRKIKNLVDEEKKDLISKITEKLAHPMEYHFWVQEQISQASGMFIGFVKKLRFDVKIANPQELQLFEYSFPPKENLELAQVIALR